MTVLGHRDEANRLGVLIDLSHVGAPGVAKTVERSTAPVCAIHSNAKALTDHRRNLSDDQIRAIGRQGGMIGVCFVPMFLTPGKVTAGAVGLDARGGKADALV